MKRSFKGFAFGIGMLALAALVQCSSVTSNPASVPSPLVELPTSLQLPDARIDVSEIASPSFQGISFFVGSGGPYSDEIAIAPNRIGDANFSFGIVLQPLKDLEIPVGTDILTFTSRIKQIPFEDTSPDVEVKLDFADFDYDGNGIQEGCSGNTAGLPICLRMWAGGERFISAVFDQFPTPENPGAGRIKYEVVSTVFGEGGDVGVRFAFVYDHADPKNKTTDFLLYTPPESFALSLRRALIFQVGPEGSARKTINFSDKFHFGEAPQDSTIQYTGSFLQNFEDFDFWSGSLEISEDLQEDFPELSNFRGVCAEISSGDPVLVGACVDLGIDMTPVPFIDFATVLDFSFHDFPLAPTYDEP